jgi:hypothetical protein
MDETVRQRRPWSNRPSPARCLVKCLLLSLLLSASTSCVVTPPTPTLPPAPDYVGVSAALEAFALEKVTAYAQSVEVPSFDLEVWSSEESTQAVEDGRLQLLVSAAPPPSGWFATPMGFEQIAVIANPDTGARDLTQDELRQIFSGSVRTWDEIDGPEQPIQLVIPPQGDELRRQFEELIMGDRLFPRTALLAPTPAAMATLVGQTSGAIGFLPFSASPEATRVLSIDGEIPSPLDMADSGYALRFEVIATAIEEPQDGVRDWLTWLQEQP